MTLINLIEDMTREGTHQDADDRSLMASRLDVCRALSKAIGEEIKNTEKAAIEAGYAHRWNKTSESNVTVISKMPSLSDAVKAGVYPDKDGEYTSAGPEGFQKPQIKAIRRWLIGTVKTSERVAPFVWK